MQSARHLSPGTFNYAIVCVAMVLGALRYCYFASGMLFKFKDCSQRIYGSLWYKMTRKQQRDLMFMILYMQRDRHIKAYDFVEISLNTFIKVI